MHRATLDVNLRHVNSDYEALHDKHSRDLRNKDSELRKLKKSDLQLKVARENLEHVRQILEKKKAEVRADTTILHSFLLLCRGQCYETTIMW